jgi:hypothetical protein
MPTEPEPFDLVIVDEANVRSIYVKPRQKMNSRAQKTVMELICGWVAVNNRRDVPAKVQEATQENWDRAIGLVVCGLAERIQL